MQLIKRNDQGEFFTEERCFITEMINHPTSPDLSLARCRVKVGVTTQLHALTGVAETYLIEVGTGIMDGGQGKAINVAAGDAVTIPAGAPQRIKNTSDEDLIFVVTCRPRFTPACYVNLEPI